MRPGWQIERDEQGRAVALSLSSADLLAMAEENAAQRGVATLVCGISGCGRGVVRRKNARYCSPGHRRLAWEIAHPGARAKQLGLALDPLPVSRRAAALGSFHPRCESPAEALAGERKAQRQETAILAWLRERPGLRFTPSEVHAAFPQWPLTSIRRALTNLADPTGRAFPAPLTHWPGDRRVGPYGAKESCWSLADA